MKHVFCYQRRLVFIFVICLINLTFGKVEASIIYNSYNADATSSNPTIDPIFELSTPMKITGIVNYHWNGGVGVDTRLVNGTIGIDKMENGVDIGPIGTWQAISHPGDFGNLHANWWAYPNVILEAGFYKIVDSDHATWSYTTSNIFGYIGNTGKDWQPYKGMSIVLAEPVPLPPTIFLFGTGIAGLVGSRLRKRKRPAKVWS